MNNLITVYPEAFPETEMEKVIHAFNTAEPEVGQTSDHDVNLRVRRSSVVWLPQALYPSVAVHVSLLIKDANKKHYGYLVDSMQSMQVSKYDSSEQGYDWHVDTLWMNNEFAFQRKLSMIIQLSDADSYRGGDVRFDNIHGPLFREDMLPHIRQKGTAIIFPSWLRHKVEPVTQGERMSLVVWAEGPSFR
jgi:PKHD-type hydroxylase